jgi:4a-hydroxytetrahydrobiopterin dehydratase
MSKRILVVDDDPRVAFVLRESLRRLDGVYTVDMALNGYEALEKARADPYDLVVTDVKMPEMDGVELTQALKSLDPTVEVIWVTAYAYAEVKADATRLGVYSCLAKPVLPIEIRRRAREALARREGATEAQASRPTEGEQEMDDLAQDKVQSYQEGESALEGEQIGELLSQLDGWEVVEQEGIKRLEREFEFPNFRTALAFTNQVGQAAEEANHHPAICTEWGEVTVKWWTHKVGGLHRNDFIMAARTDRLYRAE